MQRAINIRGLSKGQVPERDVRGITTGGLDPGTVSAKNVTPLRTGLRASRAECRWTNGEVRLGSITTDAFRVRVEQCLVPPIAQNEPLLTSKKPD